MARKLRINVVCSSRDRRFLVLAEREWTLATFRECAEDVFVRLYPHEPKLRISGLQNEFHFDIPLSYKVDEVLVDAGLVFALEKEVSVIKSLSQVASAESKKKVSRKHTSLSEAEKVKDDCNQPSSKKKVKIVKKASRSVKIQTSRSEKTTDSSSINRVSSTTSPTLTEEVASLMPQIVEKISEDSVVDIESVDDSLTQISDDASNTTGLKRKVTGRKTSQQLLRKARKLKKKTLNTT